MLPYGEGGSARLVQGPIGAAVWPHDNPDPVLFSNSVDDATIGCTVSAANEIPADKSASCLGSFNPGSDAAIPRHNNADVESFLNDVYGPFHSGGNITMDPSSASIAEYSDDIMHGGSLGFDFEGAMHEQSNVDGCGADLSFSGAIDPGLFHESAWPFQTTAVTPFQSAATVSVGPDTTQSQSPNGCQGQIVYAAKQSESNNQ